MARSRNIKPGFFRNEELADLPAEVRLLFIGLWTLADREGRAEDRPRRIKAELFPFDAFDVDPMLTQLQSKGFVVRYEVSGARFLQILNFVKHQDPHYKEKASEIPPAPGAANLIDATGITRETRARIMERDGYKCRACGAEEYLSIDHVVPASRGGNGEDVNLQVLCLKCNREKGNKLPGDTKGTRRSKHDDTSIRTRPELKPTLSQASQVSSGSVPLIPDSLIPSPLIPDNSSLRSESAVSAKAERPPPSPFDGRNAEALNGKAVVPIAAEFDLPEAWGFDAEALGFKPDEVMRQAEKFRQYWTAGKGSGTRRSVKGWRQSWSNWLDKAARDQR